MTTNTTFLNLKTYAATTDGSALFQTFRGDIAGTAVSSNMNILDTFAQNISASVVDLQSRKFIVVVPALYSSANYYIANGISQITSYTANQVICLSLDTTSGGTISLNINSLGAKTLQKLDINGNLVNFEANELKKNHLYLFKYNGSVWVWIDGLSIDQISTIGATNNLLMISPCGVVIDSTITTTGSRISGSYVILTNTGVTSGSYTAVQVGEDGRVVSGSNLDLYSNKSISNLTSASANVDLNPDADSTRNLGSTIKSWFYGFINKIVMTSGSVATPSASQVVLYNNNGLLEAKDSGSSVYFVSQKKKGNFFIVYPNPTLTNGATAASQVQVNATTFADFTTVSFSNIGSPTAVAQFAFPWDYDGGALTANFYFSTSGSVSGSSLNVSFGICGRGYPTNFSMDYVYSTMQYVTTTSSSAANMLYISPTSGSFMPTGAPVALNLAGFAIRRNNTIADNLPLPVRFHGVMINYTRSQN